MRSLLRLFLFSLAFALPAAAQPVTGLSDWSLVLDPGHGGSNQNVGANNYSEANKVLAIGLELRRLFLEHTDIGALNLTRTADVDVSLGQRVDLANQLGADYFHSIHSNAAAPSVNYLFVLWPQYPDGAEAEPNGGRRMARHLAARLSDGMRIPKVGTQGTYGECDFYGASSCRTRAEAPKGSRNYVQGFTVMASTLSEAGFHTNPEQNQRNMNADWKRLEAKAMFWGFLDYHGLARPRERIVTGIVRDADTGLPINGAVVAVGDTSYTTDTYASLFNRYSNDPNELRNGFYYLDRLEAGTLPVQVTAPGYEPFTGTVAPIDTFFTFKDVTLVSTVPPVVTRSTPEDGAEAFRIVDPLVLTFSRQMDSTSVVQALELSPSVPFTVRWEDGYRRLVLTPTGALEPLTDYTLRLGAGAQGRFGHGFDGDADGTAGGDFVVRFRTGFPDVVPPRLTASSPAPNSQDVEVQPVVTAVYDEPLDPASLQGRVALERLADGYRYAGRVTYDVVDGRGVVSFFPEEMLAPSLPHRLVFAPGIADAFGNAEPSEKQVRFTTGTTRFVVTPIDGFETGFEANWWAPQQSGSTVGIVTDSTAARLDTTRFNPTTGTKGLALSYGWNTSGGPWLIREYLAGGPPRNVFFDATYQLQAYVFGDGSGTLFRFAVDDNGPGGHEVSPWIPVSWHGWRLVRWDLGAEAPGTWIGNGVLEGQLRFDSIQLSYAPGADAFGRIVVDDLRLAKLATATDAEEPVAGLPEGYVLHGNYPNPFNPATTLRFTVPQAGRVTLRVYNALGAEVATLVDGQPFAPGTHALTWDAAALPSGVYFARLQAGGVTRSVKMMLVK